MAAVRRVLRAGLIVGVAMSALGGCARYYWSKPGSTAEQFSQESQECQKQATVSAAAAASVVQNIYRNCMTTRGYVREKLTFPSSSAHRGYLD